MPRHVKRTAPRRESARRELSQEGQHLICRGKRVRREEDVIQEASVLWARSHLLPGYAIFAIPNGGHRAISEAVRLKATGTLAGVVDLMLIGPGGRTGCIEMKTRTGSLRKAQREFRDHCLANDIPWALCRSLEEFKATLTGWSMARAPSPAPI